MTETATFALAFGAIVLGVLLVLLLAFVVMSRIVFGVSGWSRLAERYTASHQPDGKTFTRQHTRLGVVRYRNCSTITIAPEGLYLAVAAPVIGKHPPLLVPWSEISDARSTRLYWLPATQLDIGRPAVASVVVLRAVYEAARPYLNRWLPQIKP